MSSFFVGVCECAQSFETGKLHKCLQLFNILFSLAGMPNQHGGTEMNTGHFFPYTFYQIVSLFFGDVPSHNFKHIVAHMLQSNVEITANIGTFTHHPQNIVRKLCRISIMQANPFHTGYIGNTFDQFRKFKRLIFI